MFKIKQRLQTVSKRKKLLVSGAFVIALAAGALSSALTQPQPTGADTSPLVQQVNHNTEELGNHEDRISNNERDINDLHNHTGTPSNSNNVTPRTVNTPSPSQPVADPTPTPAPTPAPAPAPAPNPRTIVRVLQHNVDAGVSTCRYELQSGEVTGPIQQDQCYSAGDILP